MISKDDKISLNSEINENDTINPDLNKQIFNFNIFNFHDLKNQNQLNCLENNNSSLNNNYNYSQLLNNEIKSEKELYNLNDQSKHVFSDWKNFDLDLPSSNISNNNINKIIPSLIIKDNNTSSQKINRKIQKYKNELNPHKKPTGRIKKKDKKDGKHNKFSDDNVRKKIKHIIIRNVMKFLNMKIKKLFKGNIGNNIFKKELLTLNKTPKFESTVEYNKKLLTKTLKELFSEKISTRFTNYSEDFNKNLIEKLINEEDQEKRDYFQKLFNLTFLDCLHHFNRVKDIKELEGMDCIDDTLEEFNNDKEYKETLQYNIKNYETILNKKRSRISKKKKLENIEGENN